MCKWFRRLESRIVSVHKHASFRALILVKDLTLSPEIKIPTECKLYIGEAQNKVVILLMDTMRSTSCDGKKIIWWNEFTIVSCSPSQVRSSSPPCITTLSGAYGAVVVDDIDLQFFWKTVLDFKGNNSGWKWISLNQKNVQKAAISRQHLVSYYWLIKTSIMGNSNKHWSRTETVGLNLYTSLHSRETFGGKVALEQAIPKYNAVLAFRPVICFSCVKSWI